MSEDEPSQMESENIIEVSLQRVLSEISNDHDGTENNILQVRVQEKIPEKMLGDIKKIQNDIGRFLGLKETRTQICLQSIRDTYSQLIQNIMQQREVKFCLKTKRQAEIRLVQIIQSLTSTSVQEHPLQLINKLKKWDIEMSIPPPDIYYFIHYCFMMASFQNNRFKQPQDNDQECFRFMSGPENRQQGCLMFLSDYEEEDYRYLSHLKSGENSNVRRQTLVVNRVVLDVNRTRAGQHNIFLVRQLSLERISNSVNDHPFYDKE